MLVCKLLFVGVFPKKHLHRQLILSAWVCKTSLLLHRSGVMSPGTSYYRFFSQKHVSGTSGQAKWRIWRWSFSDEVWYFPAGLKNMYIYKHAHMYLYICHKVLFLYICIGWAGRGALHPQPRRPARRRRRVGPSPHPPRGCTHTHTHTHTSVGPSDNFNTRHYIYIYV